MIIELVLLKLLRRRLLQRRRPVCSPYEAWLAEEVPPRSWKVVYPGGLLQLLSVRLACPIPTRLPKLRRPLLPKDLCPRLAECHISSRPIRPRREPHQTVR